MNFGLAHEEQFRLRQRLRQFLACFVWFDCFELGVVAVPVSVAWNVFVSAVFSVLVVVVFAMWAAVVVDSVTVVVTEVASAVATVVVAVPATHPSYAETQ